ncbi:hypothetical protein SESBI_29869 [Sesbania bispinosa]|nr:hypothetical protein SESBI_29869 [Sesbania bispinosa]
MSSEMGIGVGGKNFGAVVGVTDSEWTAVMEVSPVVVGSSRDAATGVTVPEFVIEGIAPVKAKKTKVNKGVVDETSSRQTVVEKKCVGSGSLRGYILKINSEKKEEKSYDFVNFSWVDPTIAGIISVYKSPEETVAFTEEYDFVRKYFLGIVECSWCVDNDRLCS